VQKQSGFLLEGITVKQSLLGFLVAPAMPGFLLMLISLWRGAVVEGIWLLSIVLPISYLFSFVIGLPVHLLLTWSRLTSVFSYVLAGGLASLVPSVIFFAWPWIDRVPLLEIISAAQTSVTTLAVSGCIVAATFWVIVRPDQS
jgi:hypothetical protein